MFGAALRLLAVGEAGQRLGDYVKHLTTKYLVLSAAGMIFLVAIVFAILAIFWGLISRNHDPVISAAIMSGGLALIGCLIAAIAYGITRRKLPSVKQALLEPVQAVKSEIPSIEHVGRRIERAAQQYGAVRVTAAAAAGGLVAGLLAKRFGQVGGYAYPRGGGDARRRMTSGRRSPASSERPV